MLKEKQMSESMRTGVLLAIAGGAMDAHSYLFRGNVFSNAQTGNVLLFGVHAAQGEFSLALAHLWPILAFMVGIFLADHIRYRWSFSRLHWRQWALAVEMALLLLVSNMSNAWDPLANALLSLACGIQVESFRSVHGQAAATTMLIGNLRSFTAATETFLRSRSHDALRHMALYSGLIVSFVLGAIVESRLVDWIGAPSILFCVILLGIVFRLLSDKREQAKRIEMNRK